VGVNVGVNDLIWSYLWCRCGRCYPVLVNAPCLNPWQTVLYSIYPPQSDGCLLWLVIYHRQLPI